MYLYNLYKTFPLFPNSLHIHRIYVSCNTYAHKLKYCFFACRVNLLLSKYLVHKLLTTAEAAQMLLWQPSLVFRLGRETCFPQLTRISKLKCMQLRFLRASISRSGQFTIGNRGRFSTIEYRSDLYWPIQESRFSIQWAITYAQPLSINSIRLFVLYRYSNYRLSIGLSWKDC